MGDKAEKIATNWKIGVDCVTTQQELMFEEIVVSYLACIDVTELENECLTEDEICEMIQYMMETCKNCCES
jgi:hypothetical protein